MLETLYTKKKFTEKCIFDCSILNLLPDHNSMFGPMHLIKFLCAYLHVKAKEKLPNLYLLWGVWMDIVISKNFNTHSPGNGP